MKMRGLLLLIVVFMIMVLVGCGSKPSESPQSPPIEDVQTSADVGLGDLVPSGSSSGLGDLIGDSAGNADLIDSSKTSPVTVTPENTPTPEPEVEQEKDPEPSSEPVEVVAPWSPAEDDIVEFACVSFEKIIRDMVGKPTRLILYSDVRDIQVLNVSDSNINSLVGIEYFTGLTELRCQNNNLRELDVSKNIRLKQLVCMDNFLTTLDVSTLTQLEWLVCWNNDFADEDAVVGLDRRKTEFFFDEVQT